MTATKITKEQIKDQKGDTDIDRVTSLTDEEIEEAARNDPDSALPNSEQLKEFKRRKNDPKEKHKH